MLAVISFFTVGNFRKSVCLPFSPTYVSSVSFTPDGTRIQQLLLTTSYVIRFCRDLSVLLLPSEITV